MLKKIITLTLTVLLVAGLLNMAGCGKNEGNGGKKGSSLSGTVKLAVPNWNVVEIQTLVEAFNEKYPDIEVEFEGFDGTPSDYLAANSSSGTMPDVLWGDWGSIPFAVSQGWLYPLNEFLDNDEEKKYIPETLLIDYTYGGMVYAVPNELHFYGIVINKDLINQLNADIPENDWTVDDYQALLKKAATAETSGTENLFLLDEFLCGVYNKDIGINTYNKKTKSFSFSENFLSCAKIFRDLRAVANLEAWSLRGKSATDTGDDYTKKFNLDKKTAEEDQSAAFKTGKVASCIMGTFDSSWLRYMTFDWDIMPFPQATEGARLPMTANASYICSTCKNPEAAYELLKWLSFGSEGNVKKMDYYAQKETEDLTTGYLFYFPCTSHPDVVKKFKENKNVPDGCRYMYENLNNSFRQDLAKIIPDYEILANDIIGPKSNSIRDGSAEASAVAAEMDQKVNMQIKSNWNDFNDELEAIQKDFEDAHKK